MLSEKMKRLDAEIQQKDKASKEKVEAFAVKILQQCQDKGFTIKEVELLIAAVNSRFGIMKHFNEHTTLFRYEE